MAETVAKIKGTDRQQNDGGLSRGLPTGLPSPSVDDENSRDGGAAPVPSAEGSLRHDTCRTLWRLLMLTEEDSKTDCDCHRWKDPTE
jgi:hypothetical protein